MHVVENAMELDAALGPPAAAEEALAFPDAPSARPTERLAAVGPHAVRVIAEVGRATAVLLAVVVPYVALRSLSLTGLVAVCVLAGVWAATLRSARAAGQGMLEPVPTVAVGSATGLVVVAALDPWFPGLQLGPFALLAIAGGVLASAAIWEAAVRRTSVGRRRVLIIGSEEVSSTMASELGRAGVRELELATHLPNGEVDAAHADVPHLGGLTELAPIVEAQRPDLVVLTDEKMYADAVERLLDMPGGQFRVVGLAGFFEHALGRIPLEQITPAWFLGLLHPRQRIYTRFSKRIFDVLVAGLGLIAAAPLLPVLALLTKTTPGPVLYRQTRVGESGKQFTIYKFRTMKLDAEREGPALPSEDDPRATGIGRVLRRTHLDELPQLWNVLRGDMSIVGPRPERPEFIASLEEAVPFWNRRLLVKPGITGWAQVRCEYGVDRETMAKKLSYDLWYLRHRSLLVDLAICAMTFREVLRRSGRAATALRH